MATPFSNKCKVLGQFWILYRYEEEYSEFLKYNDVGLPLAYYYGSNLIVELSEEAIKMVEETWNLFAEALKLDEIDPNREWQTLEEVFIAAGVQPEEIPT